ncbi:MAG: hypothetical protein LLG04_13695 [Parachlamydia sp.]|nr:hypothetical protein [Parachlamydia sp.]
MTTPPVHAASNSPTISPQQTVSHSSDAVQVVAQPIFHSQPWTDEEWDEYFLLNGVPDAPAPELDEEMPIKSTKKPRHLTLEDEDPPKISDATHDPEVLELSEEKEAEAPALSRLKRNSEKDPTKMSGANHDTEILDLLEEKEAVAPVLIRLKRRSEKSAEQANPFDRIQNTSGNKRRTKVVKLGKVAEVEAEEEISGEAVQQMSIRRIALSRILKTCPPKGAARELGLSAIKQISRLAKRMIDSFNKKMEKEGKKEYCFQRVKFDKESFQEKWNPAERQGFHLKVYTRTISSFSKLVQALEELGAQAQNPKKEVQQELSSCRVDTILLFYREEKHSQKKNVPCGTLFALPTGEGWSATEECTDWKFSRNVAKRCLSSEINSYAYRGLVGNNLSDDLILKKTEVLPRTRTYDKLITSFRARLKPDSSLYQLPFFQTRQRKPPQRGINLSAEMGCVHPCKQMSLLQIAQLLDHLSHIAMGETTYKIALDSNGKIDAYPLRKIPEEDATNFWDDIILAGHKEAKKLRSALLNEVWLCFKGVREICLDFYHKHVNDYCNASKYELFYRKRPLTSWSTPKSAQEMIQLARQQCPTLSKCRTVEEFQEELNHIVVKFNTAGNIKEDTFANYFEGEVRCKSKVFFKVGTQWYRISTDYTKWVEVEFQSLLKRCIVPKEQKLLPKCWPERPASQKEERFYAEGVYNRSYASTQGYLLGDKITPDGVELFDLAYYCQNTGNLYLIAVKSGFGRTTREACAQLRDSSEKLHPELIGEAKQSILDQLIARIKQRDSHQDPFAPWGGEEDFKKLFTKLYREKKIVFTYAFADSAKKERQLADEIALTVQFSPSHFSQIGMDAGTILNGLNKMGYLDDKGALTSKFISTTKKAFLEAELPGTKTIKGQIYDQLYRQGSSKFDSTIARLELLNLEKDLLAKGFSLAICQIARTSQTSSTPTEEELPGLLRLEAMPQVDEIDFCEGDAFEHQGSTYRIDRTEADGACGLHAALGREMNGVFTCPAGGQAARQEFVEKLQAMKQEEFIELAQEHLTNLIHEYYRLRDKCNPSSLLLFQQAEIKRLFLQYANKRDEIAPEEMQAKEELWSAFQAFFTSLSKNDAKAVELHSIFAGTSGMDLATFQQSEGLLKKAFDENILTLKEWIDKHIGLNHPVRKALGQIKGIQGELEETLETLIQNPRFIQGYFKALTHTKYWLFSDELGFVAKLYKRNLSLYHQRQGRIELAVNYGDSDAPITHIFHEQIGDYAHFSHISHVK